MKLRAKYLRVAPCGVESLPGLEIELVSGEVIQVVLDRAHGRAVAGRVLECVDGRIGARPPSRQALEIELVVEAAKVPA